MTPTDLIVYVVLFLVVLCIVCYAMHCYLNGSNRKPKDTIKPKLTINDLEIPPILPLFKNHSVKRGVEVTADGVVRMTWEHPQCNSDREYKITRFETVAEFHKEWKYQEINYYLRNVEVFGKSLYKKRVKKK